MYYEFHDDHPMRPKMIIRAAIYFNLVTQEEIDKKEMELMQINGGKPLEGKDRLKLIPFDIRRLYLYFSYKELIRPLVRYDYVKKEMSLRAIAMKYDVSKDTIAWMIKGKKY